MGNTYKLVMVCIAVTWAVFAGAAPSQDFNVEEWARENIHSSATQGIPITTSLTDNKHYLLNIYLPENYHQNTDKHFPVVYLLDPYWDFNAITSMLGALVYDKYIPELIVVGIGYAGDNPDFGSLRQLDYTPTVDKIDKNSGGAKAFLSFLENEVIPKIERDLRVDPSFRGLVGSSLGGLFGLYSMFERPELFQGYIVSSPAILWGRRWIMQREIAFFWGDSKELWKDTPARNLPTRLFMTAGEPETELNWLYEVQAFDRLIAHRKYGDFSYEFHTIAGVHHGGVKFPTFARGLAFMFKQYIANDSTGQH